jgi:hypothetical protein
MVSPKSAACYGKASTVGATEDGKRAIERLKVRREMRSADLEEDSTVIEQKAYSRRGSVPAPARGLAHVLDKLPPWGRVIVIVALIVALVVSGVGAKLAGWF